MAHIPGHAATNTFFDFNPEWWGQVLGQFEPAQYYSSPAGRDFAGRSPRQGRYFQNAYQDILQDYYGQAGASMRAGQSPMSFMQYMDPTPDENRANPWTARYSSLPQASRGVTGMAANPRTRFLFNY